MPFIVQSIPTPEKLFFEKEVTVTNRYFRSSKKTVNAKLNELVWVNSTVGNSTTGENTVDSNIRNSFKGKEPVVINFDYQEKKYQVGLDKFYPDFKFKYRYDFNEEGNYIHWEAIRYLSGGFFARHIDGQEDTSHYGTVIILPPTNYNVIKEELTTEPVYTGGELILEDTEITADETQWKIVLFTIDTPHKLKLVLSGERIIFKSKMKYTLDMKYLMDSKVYNQPTESDFKKLVDDFETEINELKEKIIQLEEERNSIINGDLHENQFIKEIKGDQNKEKNYYTKSWSDQFIVLLEDHYNVPIPNSFKEEDKYTFNLILKYFPGAIVRVMNIGGKINMGDSVCNYNIYFSKQTENIDVKDKNESHYKFEDIPVYYNFEKSIIPGNYVNSDSVYNDQTYDRVEICDFTILYIQV
jgi:hypothetical protein